VKKAPAPPSLSPRALAIAGWAAFAIAGILFITIAWQVSGGESRLLALDERLSAWMEARHTPGLVALFLAVTHLNSMAAIGAWSVVFGIVLARLRERYWLLTLALAVGGGMILNLVLKGAFERLRPRFENPLLFLDTYSFPSGHTAASVAFYGVLAAFLVSRFHDRRRRAACVAGAIGAVALVALSRVYLGAHYLTDVLAAICSSTVWLVLCLAGGHAVVRGRLERKWFLTGAVVLLALASTVLLPLADWSERFEAALVRMDLVTGLVVFCVVSAMAGLLLLPIWIFAIAAGAVFGFGWGLAVTMSAALLSALAAFLLGRYVLRRPLQRLAKRNAAFKAMDAAVAQDGWKMVALLRVSPIMPSGLKSYFLGLTRVRLADYLSASMAGMLPALLLKVYIGDAGRGALSEGGPLNWTLLAAGLAATVGLALLVGRRARRKLNPFFA
jgi:undecaprenyl-diphosphatase